MVKEESSHDSGGKVDGVVASSGQETQHLEEVHGVEGEGHERAASAAHVDGGDDSSCHVARVEEEEGDVSHGKIRSGAEEFLLHSELAQIEKERQR